MNGSVMLPLARTEGARGEDIGYGRVRVFRVPTEAQRELFTRMNEAARREDRERDTDLTAEQRMEIAIRLSKVCAELAENAGRSGDVRPG